MNSSQSQWEPAQWEPVSGSTDLAVASARAVSLSDHDIAIWRSGTGEAHAWENRCPHRGMRLSFGQVRGDNLVCRYHGWSYDRSGQCQRIPASPEMTPPPTACVKTFACREALGLIWLKTGDDDADGLSALAADHDIAESPLFCKSIYVDGTYDTLIDRLQNSADAKFECSELAPGLISATVTPGDAAGESLIIGVQICSQTRLALHIVVKSVGEQNEDDLRRLHYGKWAQRLRWQLNQTEAQT